MKRQLLNLLLVGSVCTSLFVGSSAFAQEATEAVQEATEAVQEATEAAQDVTAAEEPAEAEEEEDYTTGDASLDNTRNQDEIGEKEILVVSFGTSYNDSRRLTIGAIEQAVEDAYPDWSVRRAFTSQIIIDHVERRDKVHIDNVTEALERAMNNGVKHLVVLPTHLMAGFEYQELEEQLAGYADVCDIQLVQNLLDTQEDLSKVEAAIVNATKDYDDGETAIVFMGHGTEAESNGVYATMQEALTADGYENYYVGTVEASPSLEDVIASLSQKEYKKVVLRPLMVVAGDHAHNDMAAEDDPESWYSILTGEGYEVECILDGLGQLEEIRDIYLAHLASVISE